MFAAHCPSEHQDVLLNLSSIESMTRTASGVAVTFTCTCGNRATVHSGRGGPFQARPVALTGV